MVAGIHSVLAQLPLSTVSHPLTLVDFCSGSGHTGILLAVLFPQHRVVCVERNAQAVSTGRERVVELQLTERVTFLHHSIYDPEVDALPFDVGIGLHACGTMSDVIHAKCLARRAAYVLASCCVGKIKLTLDDSTTFHPSNKDERSPVVYPRSQLFRETLSPQDYMHLASAGDWDNFEHSLQANEHRMCKRWIEVDRNLAASELGYTTNLFQMAPWTCSPKHDIITGVYGHRDAARTASAPATVGSGSEMVGVVSNTAVTAMAVSMQTDDAPPMSVSVSELSTAAAAAAVPP